MWLRNETDDEEDDVENEDENESDDVDENDATRRRVPESSMGRHGAVAQCTHNYLVASELAVKA